MLRTATSRIVPVAAIYTVYSQQSLHGAGSNRMSHPLPKARTLIKVCKKC